MVNYFQVVYQVKYRDLLTKRSHKRDLNDQILLARRELIPLTTGLVVNAKKERTARLRARVRLLHKSVCAIQSLWRQALVRVGYIDPARDYWIECFDEEQGEDPYYYNTWTLRTLWKQPLAYKYFHMGARSADRQKKEAEAAAVAEAAEQQEYEDQESSQATTSYNDSGSSAT